MVGEAQWLQHGQQGSQLCLSSKDEAELKQDAICLKTPSE